MLDNANSYALISGVYGTAWPIERSTASNIFLTKRLLLIVALSGHLCTMYLHKYAHKGHDRLKTHTHWCLLLSTKSKNGK